MSDYYNDYFDDYFDDYFKMDNDIKSLKISSILVNTVFDSFLFPCEFERILVLEKFVLKIFYLKNYTFELTVNLFFLFYCFSI